MVSSLILAVLMAAAPQESGIRIDGVVLEGITQQPLPSVNVQIAGIKTKTDRQGRFALDNVPAGKQKLVADRDGYLRARLDTRKVSGGSGIDLSLKAGESLRNLTLHIFPAGAINGRIFDSTGRSVQGATIYVFRSTFNELGGRSLAGSMGNVAAREDCALPADARIIPRNDPDYRLTGLGTDDRGEFRIYNLEPGQYGICIRAGSPPSTFFYPSATEWRNATMLDIGLGADLRLGNTTLPKEITVAPRRAFIPDEPPPGEVPPQILALRGVATIVSPDGSSRGASDIGVAFTQPNAAPVHLESGYDGTFYTTARTRETLTASSISGVPPGVCVRSFRQGDRNVLRNGLSLQPDAASFTLTLGPSEVELTGIARDSAGQKAPGAFIVLVPDDRNRFELFSATTADQNGAFQIPCASTGNYRLYSWFSLDGQSYRNADFLRPYTNAGSPIRIEKGGALEMDVKVID
jgi:hypothetical protein